MQKNLKKGFTLIELLVVIAIIGILSSVVLVSLNSARQKARDAARKTNTQQIQTALALYSDSFDKAVPPIVDCTAATVWSGWVTALAGPDFVGCPKDLVLGTANYLPRLITDTVANTYGYRNDVTGGGAALNTFCMVTDLEAGDSMGCNSSGCFDLTGVTTQTVTACAES